MKCPYCSAAISIKTSLEKGSYVWGFPFSVSLNCHECKAPLRLQFDNGKVFIAEWMGFPSAENWQAVPETEEVIAARWIVDAFEIECEGKKYVFQRK